MGLKLRPGTGELSDRLTIPRTSEENRARI